MQNIQKREYQICTYCIMDTTEPNIEFDDHGRCNHCKKAERDIAKIKKKFTLEALEITIDNIKKSRTGDYDCILGLSGGLDSSYMVLLARQFDLKPLIVHVDAGWNSELAVKNIEKLVYGMKYDLYTEVINWDEMRDLQLSFFKASVKNQDIPQDHAFKISLIRASKKHKIKYLLSGNNYASECILPNSWGFNNLDGRHIRGIHKRFGQRKLNSFPIVTLKELVSYKYLFPINKLPILNYINYNTFDAIKELEDQFNWSYYGGKHQESRFTRFHQNYYLPNKFGINKNRAHLSSQVVSGEITRDVALEKVGHRYDSELEERSDLEYVAKKLGLDSDQFRKILLAPPVPHQNYPSWESLFNLKTKLSKVFS